MSQGIRIKRAYETPSPKDGRRVLVERLWPRGVRKEALALDAWLKDVAPSDTLRRWFGHDPERWAEFSQRYIEELRAEPAASSLRELRRCARSGPLTLIYAAKDEEHNSALVLHGVLTRSRARR
jgi:uncharacterized protein YeaO (DUF488 family)